MSAPAKELARRRSAVRGRRARGIMPCGVVASLVVVGTIPMTGGAQTLDERDGTEARARFIAEARSAGAAYVDPDEARRAGFRRLGPDFPGMGQHWVHPARVLSGVLDASLPPLLCYTEIDGRLTFVGAAYALPLTPGEAPPEHPLGRHVWHDHAGAVDEEALLLTSAPSMHGGGDGHRIAMVHVWATPNPEGALAQNNWTLPFLRAGLPVPASISRIAARGLSLAQDGGRFYRELIRRAVSLSAEELARLDEVLTEASAEAGALIRSEHAEAPLDPESRQKAFEDLWSDFWREVAEVIPGERWSALAAFVDGAPPDDA